MNKKFLASYLILTIIYILLPGMVFGAAVQNTNPTGDQSPTLSGNTEVGEVVWVNNVLQVRTRAAGTGTVRSVQLTTGTSNTGIVVNSSGNVGIGLTPSSARLDVSGDVAQNGSVISSMGSWTTIASSTPNWYTLGYISTGRGYGEFLVENILLRSIRL